MDRTENLTETLLIEAYQLLLTATAPSVAMPDGVKPLGSWVEAKNNLLKEIEQKLTLPPLNNMLAQFDSFD